MIENWGHNPLYKEPSASSVSARDLPVKTGVIGSRAKAYAFAAKAGAAPRVLRRQVRLATTRSQRILKQTGVLMPRTDRMIRAAQRELAAECRALFRRSRQDYGVPIAGHVARIGGCLDRLCALRGDASMVTKTAIMRGIVARALDGKDTRQVLRTGRGLGEHRKFTSAEADFKRGQLEGGKLPQAVRERIAQSLVSRIGGDSPTLRLIRDALLRSAAERAQALPTDQLKVMNKDLSEENDALILAARLGKSGAGQGGQG